MSHRAWVIFAVFLGHKPQAVARVYNKSDAEAHVRFLRR
jgi:hypothetical protein